MAYHSHDGSAFDRALPNDRLTKAIKAAGYDVIDLLLILRRHARQEQVYNQGDTHWNRRGNEIAANAILERLLPVLDGR